MQAFALDREDVTAPRGPLPRSEYPRPSRHLANRRSTETGRRVILAVMDRRQFVERSLGVGLLVASGCAPGEARDTAGDPRDARIDPTGGGRPAARWGLQLYTVRSLMAGDVERTLADVAEIGYEEVEFAGYFGRSPAEILASLEAEGLEAPAVHLPLEEFRGRLPEAIDAALMIGHRYLVLPYLNAPDRPDIDGYRRLADEMNTFGERCRGAGLRFAYHNHDFELQAVDGAVPLDALIEGTDRSLVSFEVDLFWMVHGGADPLAYFERYPGRFELCHVKDRTSAGDMVDVGAGVIDFAAIFAQSERAGLNHYFVEHDNPENAADSIRASFEHLSSLRA